MKLSTKSFALAALAVSTLFACSAAPEGESVDDLSADEAALGSSWDGVESEAAPVDEALGALDLSTGPIAEADPLQNLGDPTEELTCNTATGYKSGVKMTICVTTIDGKLVEVNTASAFIKMRNAAAKSGVYIHIVSGFRTMAQQRYLYQLYKQGKGNLAAPPGYSNHQSGHALDLNTSSSGVYSWLTKHGGAYNFKRTVPSEIWHWEHW